MTGTKDIDALPDAERNQVRTQAIAAAAPFVETAQQAKQTLDGFTSQMNTKYHATIRNEKMLELNQLQKQKLMRGIPKGETYDTWRQKLSTSQPGFFSVSEVLSHMDKTEREKWQGLSDAAKSSAEKVGTAVDETLKKNGLEFDLSGVKKPDGSIDEKEALARIHNNDFRKAVTENLIAPLVTKETGTGPANTPGKQPAKKVGK